MHNYNVSSQLVNNIKSTFVESPNARKVMLVGMVTSLTAWKSKAFHLLNHPHHSTAQDLHYKIVLHARHRLRAFLINSHTIKQNSCNTSIQFISDL